MAKTLLLLWIVSLPGLLSATCSSNESPDRTPSLSRAGERDCLNGWCAEDGSCNCNPCWSGSACQEYVDRFGPRFLAEEPFFMVIKGAERDDKGTEVPLFRIESGDDDLGLTCQLGQVGPAATCPCATPRYKVVGPSQALFRADPETGDVFIRRGYSLQQGKHYLITLQVAALEVNASGYHPWREEVRSTLFVTGRQREVGSGGKSAEQFPPTWPGPLFLGRESSSLEPTAGTTHESTAATALSPWSQPRSPQMQMPSGSGSFPPLTSPWYYTSQVTRTKRNPKSSVNSRNGNTGAGETGENSRRGPEQRIIYRARW